MTSSKLCVRFRLASRSATLDDLELQEFLISRDFADCGGVNSYINEGSPILSVTEL